MDEEIHLDAMLATTEGFTTLDECRLLYRLARNVAGGCIVEVGSYRGRSTVALACGSRDGNHVPVYAIEPHETFTGVLGGQFGSSDRAAFFRAMLDTQSWEYVRLVNLPSSAVAPAWITGVSLLWIDGDHRYEAVLSDWNHWSPHLNPQAVVVFDDAADPNLGPYRLVSDLARREGYDLSMTGKLAVLVRAPS